MKSYRFVALGLLVFLIGLSCGNDQNATKEQEEAAKGKGKKGKDSIYHALGFMEKKSLPQGLKVGDRAPAIEGRTQAGDSIQLEQILEKGPLVLFFYRGEWCPICNQYLKRYSDSLKLLQKAGANVLGITPEGASKIERIQKKTASSIPILPDTAYQIMEAYQVKFRVNNEYKRKVNEKLDAELPDKGKDTAAFYRSLLLI